MSNTMMLYWFTRLDSVHEMFQVLLTISLVMAVILLIVFGIMFLECDKFPKKVFVSILLFSISSLFFGVAYTLTPTTKEVAFIYLGGKLADYGSNNEDLKQIPDKAIKLLNNKMEQYLEEQKKEIDKIKEGK